ncbi:HD domain-containing protein [Massilia arenosa]|uniref:HD domain-containing protein n=1 Tax=Zemynaea arenosa TaxID=2561931 RepID=A0A4Y9SFN6_9BURK|nr:HD domain-containing protein [Massilia arenosa]TFW22426.1 HD domain-containing protein [Massilia arenosa]
MTPDLTTSPLIDHWQPRLAAIAAEANDGDGAHDMAHLHRVWGNARRLLAAQPEADALIVLAACYLHDLVNLPKNHPDRALASRQSAEYATKRLHILDFPPDLLAGVAHAIEAHSFSARITPRTIEAQIVQDADRLDALGAVGLARLFYIAGRMGSMLAHPNDPLAEARDLDDRTYALDHIIVKLATLPGMMNTAEARRIGDQRLADLHEFRARFADEWSAGIS